MNQIKRYLRSTVTEQHLNHIIIQHIYKEKLDKSDLIVYSLTIFQKIRVEKLF